MVTEETLCLGVLVVFTPTNPHLQPHVTHSSACLWLFFFFFLRASLNVSFILSETVECRAQDCECSALRFQALGCFAKSFFVAPSWVEAAEEYLPWSLPIYQTYRCIYQTVSCVPLPLRRSASLQR